MSVETKIFKGKFTANGGTAFNVAIGFKPSVLIGYNAGDPALFMWVVDHGDLKGFVDPTGSGAGAEMSAGISAYDGGDVVASAALTYQDGTGSNVAAGLTTAAGFTVGTDANINTGSEVSYFVAIGSAPPTAAIPYRIDGSTAVHTHEDEN